jgi:transposase-like protein/DNA-directed RNA polymerase subunit RPC12/RpoP
MEDYPRTMLELEKRFATEEACLQFLAKIRWPDGFQCPRCGSNKAWHTKRGLYHCGNCGHQVSVTAGTIFQDTRKPLHMWFRAIWGVTSQKHGVSALGLQRDLGLGSYHTAWAWLHKLRRAMVRTGRDRLSGTVEVDETYIGGVKPGKKGRGAAGKTLVVIAVEITGGRIGRIRLRRVRDASVQSLSAAVKECVEPGALAHTDAWSGYGELASEGYRHVAIRQEADAGEHLLPHAHKVAALLKRWLLGTHQGAVHPSHLDFYLDEFTFRFNRRTSRSCGKLFYRLIQQAVAIEPVKGHDLVGGKPDFR